MKRCLKCMKTYEDQYEICPHCGYIENTPPKEIYFLKPGTVLQNRFIIGTSVGSGGFGIVYRAWDQNLEKVVAIKEFFPISYANRTPGQTKLSILPKRRDEFNKEISRFLEEARYLAKFSSHPNIINVYSFFEENNTAYINMEFLEGVSYKDFIRGQGGKVLPETAVNITVAVLGALKEIHKEHIIHRDVSPDNIFICNDGRIKLMDFGAARFSKEEESNFTIILKPGYAPPEQYQSKSRQGTFTDVYAVGAVLYRSVTGIKPCESTNRTEKGVKDNPEKDELVNPRELTPEISDNLNNVIMRAMAIQPELRFQTDEEFIKALQNHTEGSVRSVDDELRRRKRRRGLFAGVAVILLLIGGAAGYGIYSEGRARVELKATNLTVWVKIPEDYLATKETDGKESTEGIAEVNGTEGIEEKDERSRKESCEQSIRKALAEFSERYPQITLEITAIPEEEYDDRIRQASQENALPDVYSEPGDEALRGAELKRVFSYLDEEEYLGLSDYENVYLSGDVCPVTFRIPVVYRLKAAEDFDSAQARQEYEENIEDGRFDLERDKIEAFLNGERSFVLADTSIYWQVQETLAGRYEMAPVEESEGYAMAFGMTFCVSRDADTRKYNAAIQLLNYLLGEKAQSSLCITDHLDLPLNKNIYARYKELNIEYEALDGVFDGGRFIR